MSPARSRALWRAGNAECEMAAFHEILFPLDIALHSAGGPQRRTEIVALGSGREERNARARGNACSFANRDHRRIDNFDSDRRHRQRTCRFRNTRLSR